MSSYYHAGTGLTRGSNFGFRTDPFTGERVFHSGIDYRGNPGVEIPAAANGTIVYSGYNQKLGNTVIIRHTDNSGGIYYTSYSHMNGDNMPAINVSVEAGDVIGNLGNTGTRTTGPHLHFSILIGNITVNPAGTGSLGFSLNEENTINPSTFNG